MLMPLNWLNNSGYTAVVVLGDLKILGLLPIKVKNKTKNTKPNQIKCSYVSFIHK